MKFFGIAYYTILCELRISKNSEILVDFWGRIEVFLRNFSVSGNIPGRSIRMSENGCRNSKTRKQSRLDLKIFDN